ncbi:DUF1311 domain-containing protein [Duganella dendranthematis]|uniref:DUF1311 domain-containing protein n=1 Tax=Duganella dendranthematis TaxID=2728021 RepID=A0ABX6MAX9_9BURK|nr:lysozyme inhibitor LprI family protein [Duganella dendranthematis]QJD91246.1 DUF1311 domain-containing protein [Duganella dendranthematis]
MKRIFFTTLIALIGLDASAASFDCAMASTAIEKRICTDAQLSDLDTQLSQSYKKTISSAADVDSVKAVQRAWITTVRNKCQDATCLKDAYSARIAQLDGKSAPPTNTIPALNVAPTGAQDQPEATDVAASIPLKSDSAELPSKQPVTVTPPPSPKAKVSPTVAAPPMPASAEEPAPTSPKDPGIGLTDLFQVLFSIGMLALIVGMVRPSLAARWITTPTRKRILGLMLIYLIPVAWLSSFTRTPERIAYDTSVKEQKEAERQAKRVEQENRSGSGGGNRRGSRYENEVNRFVAIVHRAKSSGAMSRNPSCEAAVEDFYSQYRGSMQNDIESARRNDPTSSIGLLPSALDTAASQLSISTSNITSLCFNGQ